ncbi:MAG: hypothetical protein CM1200mP24_08290 [Gammaproteobacteria bacterium]|nr:MAG: hypothetical protein CM1200mP24_08290 [Gammaproteobacteria bacterium]
MATVPYPCLPAFRNNWLVILKTTAFASVVGVHDLVWRAKGAASATHNPFYFLVLAALVYLFFTILSERFFSYIQGRMNAVGCQYSNALRAFFSTLAVVP